MITSLLALASVHPAIHWFDRISGVIIGIFLLVVLVEFILMIPDLIRTIKIHLM
ncbi:MAG TPA: hypothetical protein VFE58_03285 [Tepidisphaeraceae bacterium]|jgi:hypothetical protein|nr:hypothetical protein [Tepidisphaeraceae bacterium]